MSFIVTQPHMSGGRSRHYDFRKKKNV